jgi:hypothetical protein
MKEPLRLPFVFLVVFLCAAVVLTSLLLFARWGLEDSEVRRFTLEMAAARLPRALFEVMLPAVLLSIVLLGFRMVRRPFSRLLGFLIILGVSYAVLVNGMIWSHRAEAGVREPTVAAWSWQQSLSKGDFARLGAVYVAPGAAKDNVFGPTLVVDPAKQAPRFTLYRSGTASAKDGEVTLKLAGTRSATIRQRIERAATPLFAADVYTDYFMRDFRTMTGDFEKLLGVSFARFLFACFALLFLVSASLSLLRVTRWPLFNVLLLVLAVRAYLLLYHVLAVDFAPTIGRVVSDPLLTVLAPSAAFIILGVLLLLIDILFIPSDRWTTEAVR